MSDEPLNFEVSEHKDTYYPPVHQAPLGEFVYTPLIRGFREIETLYHDATYFEHFICGGYARYAAAPSQVVEPAMDVDLFPRRKEVHEPLKAHLADLGFEIRAENSVSITYKRRQDLVWVACPTIQLIKPNIIGHVLTVGTVEHILSNFDFSVARAAIISAKECLVDKDFLQDEANKVLRIKNIHCPIGSTMRAIKYSAKGYYLSPRHALPLFLDWEQRDNSYRARLINLFEKSNKDGNIHAENLTKEEVDELEAMLRID